MSTEPTELTALLDDDASVRRRALAGLDLETDKALHAARTVLLIDPDATVRALAALRLGLCRDARTWSWLRAAAFDDPAPSVRDAALRALARTATAEPEPEARDLEAVVGELREASQHETVWWVRRSAVLTLAVICGADALDALVHVLDDPFWRVRHAAVQALAALGDSDPALRAPVTRTSTTAGAGALPRAAALQYLAARWATGADDAQLRVLLERVSDDAAARPAAPLDDPDPAVVAARLDQERDAAAESLVLLLDESHEPTRARAARRLVELRDSRALELTLRWLEDSRRTYAPTAARAVLDGSPRGLVRRLAARVLSGSVTTGGAGALEWALDWAVRRGETGLVPLARAHVDHDDVHVRLAAVRALSLAATDERALLVSALHGSDPRVREAAIEALGDDPALRAVPLDRQTARGRRALVHAAACSGDLARVREGLTDEDPAVRAAAVAATADDSVHAAAARDPDPWVREAALDERRAAAALSGDVDPWLRREAASLLARRARSLPPTSRLEAANAGRRTHDPWVRARAAELLDPSDSASLPLLLALSRDPALMVRAAAVERLDSVVAPVASVREALEATDELEAAMGAIARLWQLGAHDEVGVPDRWREDPGVRALLDALRAVDTTGDPASTPVVDALQRPRAWTPPEIAPVERRSLGSTGLSVAPLALSGAFDLSPGAYAEAHSAGADLFFWEPHHRNLGAFLRGRRGRTTARVVTGTFHADAPSVERDVDRALRRLRREHLDVFLLFWARSPARLDDEAFALMARLKASGKVGAIGFSTHFRELAQDALVAHPWDVVMLRHSAAHPGAESGLLALARARGAGVLTFSALCYGRLLQATGDAPPPAAADCYRYSLAQPGVAAVISAPRRRRELRENLEVLAEPTLAPDRLVALREHGARVRRENLRFQTLVRGGGTPRDAVLQLLDEAHDHASPERHEDPAGTRRRLLRACVNSRGRGRASDPSVCSATPRPSMTVHEQAAVRGSLSEPSTAPTSAEPVARARPRELPFSPSSPGSLPGQRSVCGATPRPSMTVHEECGRERSLRGFPTSPACCRASRSRSTPGTSSIAEAA